MPFVFGGMVMTETEKRRVTLLQETRKIYSEKYNPPAVHPRYQSAYQSIYKSDQIQTEENQPGTFGIRIVIAILLFSLFALASKNGIEETKTVVQEIKQEFHGLDLDGFIDFQIFH